MNIKNLTLSFGLQLVFDNINLLIKEDEKVGIIGVNGAGKTTFFKIILGLITPDEGEIVFNKNTRIGYLPQVIDDEVLNSDISVFDFLMLGRPIKKIEDELIDAYNKVAVEEDQNKQDSLLNKIGKLQSELEYWDVYNADSILLKIINGMNISDDLLDQKLKTLSGGQKSKISFARLLYSKPEIILLDEPTNHLDNTTKEYVIKYLKSYSGSVYIISHDIEFLNQVITKTLYLEKRTHKMTLYNGNYDYYKKLVEEKDKVLKRDYENQMREVNKLKATVELYSNSSGNRKKMAQSREKTLAKLLENKIEIEPERKKMNLKLEMNRDSARVPLRVKDLCFKYNKDNPSNLIDNLTFSLDKGEKFLIVGENGIGKSTLLKLIIEQLTPDSGIIDVNDKTDIGYYAQEHELLDNTKSIIDNFDDLDVTEAKVRGTLGRFLFYGNDIYKKVGILSPGERSRIALAKLSLKGANMLILDEPTNHLDPDTQKIIADTFKTFPGTMLVVSHSTSFVDNLGVERLLLLPSGKLMYYDKKIVEHFQELNEKK